MLASWRIIVTKFNQGMLTAGEVVMVQVAGREIPVFGVKEKKDRKSLLIYHRTGSDGRMKTAEEPLIGLPPQPLSLPFRSPQERFF